VTCVAAEQEPVFLPFNSKQRSPGWSRRRPCVCIVRWQPRSDGRFPMAIGRAIRVQIFPAPVLQ